ncbi:MAG TPA: phosphatidylserine decarboxylase [Bacteroidia bacterium]|jgi:phosphatidylserine decarboxylase|nr:phosphatidylserine decarboxylase [Bacteroidia bacterium]
MLSKRKYHPVIEELSELIRENDWAADFEKAIKAAHKKNVPLIENVKTVTAYLEWMNEFLYWVPMENSSGENVNDHLSASYFIADQEPLLSLQNKVIPSDKALPLTPFSQWLLDYANALGAFHDTPESLTKESEQSFYESPYYNMKEYSRPHGGWKTFNQIFARHFKPGYRPIAAVSDNSIIVMPADSTFRGQWEIRKDSNVTVKNLNWKISELLEGSPYKDRFENGIFMHSYLGPTDYHRQHAPLGGKVLEARVIQGQVYQEVEAREVEENPETHALKLKRVYDSFDLTGYQFAQTRGLIILDTPIGLVAVLPIGMSQVSSVIITAEVGVTVRKGEELSYFQFGGSDIILVFESSSNVSLTAQKTLHYKMGTKIGKAYPVI